MSKPPVDAPPDVDLPDEADEQSLPAADLDLTGEATPASLARGAEVIRKYWQHRRSFANTGSTRRSGPASIA